MCGLFLRGSYNQAHCFDADKFRRFASRREGLEFLLVNDGSTDGTLQVFKHLEGGRPDNFIVCDLPRNIGKAEAVRRGFLEAVPFAARVRGLLGCRPGDPVRGD